MATGKMKRKQPTGSEGNNPQVATATSASCGMATLKCLLLLLINNQLAKISSGGGASVRIGLWQTSDKNYKKATINSGICKSIRNQTVEVASALIIAHQQQNT